MSGISDIRLEARSDLHEGMSDPAVYLAPGGADYAAPVAVRARRHFRFEALGPSGLTDGAERADQSPKLVLSLDEIAPVKHGLVVFSSDEVWVLTVFDKPDFGYVSIKVTALPASQVAALDWSAINAAAGWA